MPYQGGETWRFEVREPSADRVFLVRHSEHGTSVWTPMAQIHPGVWELVLNLAPGAYRFGYFTCEGTAYFNGGTFGLRAERLSDADARVSVTPLPPMRLGTKAAINVADANSGAATRTDARFGPSPNAV